MRVWAFPLFLALCSCGVELEHNLDEHQANEVASVLESAGISAEHEFLRNELATLYASFVERLDERDRTFFRLRFEEQRTQVEAGEQSGLSHMQARTLEKKLRERFLKFMHSNGYLDGYATNKPVRAV